MSAACRSSSTSPVSQGLWNSVLVATLTMILSIGFGAPAGYALSRFDFPGKGTFRFLVLMTRAFRCRCWRCHFAVMFIRTGLDDTAIGLALVHTTLALPFCRADHLLAVLRHSG